MIKTSLALYFIFLFQIHFVFTNNLFADNLLSKIKKVGIILIVFKQILGKVVQVVWGTLSKQQVAFALKNPI